MSRSTFPRLRSLLLASCLATVTLSLGGCMQLLLTGAYMWNGLGSQVDPEFGDLKSGKAVVVCRPLVELQYSSTGAAQQLARYVSELLKAKGKRLDVVPPQRVEQWTDEHEWEKFTEVGKALKSDFVVGIEIEEFNLYQGQTIFQGRARVHVVVHDMKKKGEKVYERTLPQMVYPPSAGIPTSERTEEQFAREFTAFVAERIGRCFYSYDSRDDYALDSSTLLK